MNAANKPTPARKKSASPWRTQPHCSTPAARKSYQRYVENGKPPKQ